MGRGVLQNGRGGCKVFTPTKRGGGEKVLAMLNFEVVLSQEFKVLAILMGAGR